MATANRMYCFVVTFSMSTNEEWRTTDQKIVNDKYKCGHAVLVSAINWESAWYRHQSVNSIDASHLLTSDEFTEINYANVRSNAMWGMQPPFIFHLSRLDLRCEEFCAFHGNCTISFTRVPRSTASTKSFAKSLIYTNCSIWYCRHFSEPALLHLPDNFFRGNFVSI